MYEIRCEIEHVNWQITVPFIGWSFGSADSFTATKYVALMSEVKPTIESLKQAFVDSMKGCKHEVNYDWQVRWVEPGKEVRDVAVPQ